MKDSSKCKYGYKCIKEECPEGCMKKLKLDSLYENALLTEKQGWEIPLYPDKGKDGNVGVDYDKFKKISEIRSDIKNFVNQGKNLYIHSHICGNGKTESSLKLLRAYLYSLWSTADISKCRALFINVPSFLLSLKDNIEVRSDLVRYVKDNYLEADLVVWDEIGVKELTAYEHEHLLMMINNRLDAGKSNIYTSNLSPDELKSKIGERLYSRIVGLSEDIQLNGYDKRGIRR